jgi:hypothetical protein
MEPVQMISGLRAQIGASAWLAPNLTGKLFGLDPEGNPQAAFMARLFGVRDIALAAGTLGSEGDARAKWLRVGIACDLADAAAAYLAGRNGTVPRHAAILAGGTALAAAGMGVAALNQPSAPTV